MLGKERACLHMVICQSRRCQWPVLQGAFGMSCAMWHCPHMDNATLAPHSLPCVA